MDQKEITLNDTTMFLAITSEDNSSPCYGHSLFQLYNTKTKKPVFEKPLRSVLNYKIRNNNKLIEIEFRNFSPPPSMSSQLYSLETGKPVSQKPFKKKLIKDITNHKIRTSPVLRALRRQIPVVRTHGYVLRHLRWSAKKLLVGDLHTRPRLIDHGTQ